MRVAGLDELLWTLGVSFARPGEDRRERVQITIEVSDTTAAQLTALVAMVQERHRSARAAYDKARAAYDKARAESPTCCCAPTEPPPAPTEDEIRARAVAIGAEALLRQMLGLPGSFRHELAVAHRRPEPIPVPFPPDMQLLGEDPC